MPRRIQLRRTRGWRMPPNTVKVDRSGRWGNPLRVSHGYTAKEAVDDYRAWVTGNSLGRLSDPIGSPPTLDEIRLHLAGKHLACWCAIGQPCHADVLLELANPSVD